MDFFISHAGPDQQWAEWIGQQLRGAGYTVELDVWAWKAGVNFVEAMRAALDRADRVLAVYTDAYFDRPFAQAEHHGAFVATVTGRPGRLMPVRVEPCRVPELFAPLVRIDLAGCAEPEAARRLLAGVAAPPGPPPDPVGFPGRRGRGVSAPVGLPPAAEVEFPRRLPPVWHVPLRNPFFTGRAGVLAAVHDRLRRAAGEPVAVVPLQGMGGVGKTQLAVEYAHRHSGDYHAVWWVDADNADLGTTGLVDLAAALSLPTGGSPVAVLRLLWAALGERTDWLLIYDNIDDPAGFAHLRPPDSGRLLLTGRNPTLGRFAELVEVGEFDRAESVELLRRRCPALSEAQADRVAAAVGDLPLAVEQAGSFLTDTGLDVDDYLHLLATRPDQAGLADPTVDRHPGLVAVVAAGRTRLHAASPVAAAVLDQLAFCAPEPLPLTPAAETAAETAASRFGVRVGDTATTATVVRQVKNLGLAQHAGTSLQLHHLVQALLRAQLPADGQARTRRAAQQLVATANPGDPDDPASWPAYATLTPHVQALTDGPGPGDPDPGQFRALVVAVARYLYASGRYGPGRRLAEQAHRRWADTLGVDHPDSLKIANCLGPVLWASGDLAAARALLEDTLARRRRLLGDDHPDSLITANNLAVDLRASGELAAARALDEQTLARRRRVLGDDHRHTLASADNLAVDLRMSGDVAAARALDEQTLARRRRVLGPDHPDTTESANGLAEDLRMSGDPAAACTLDEDTLARRRRVLGDDHPQTLESANNLALGLRMSGDPAAARIRHDDILARCRRLLGPDNPLTLASANNLAEDLRASGDLAAARTLFEDTLNRRRRVSGEDHPDTLRSANGLAVCLHGLGDLAAARTLFEDTLNRRRRVSGDDHPDTRITAHQLARLAPTRDGSLIADVRPQPGREPPTPACRGCGASQPALCGSSVGGLGGYGRWTGATPGAHL